MNPVDETRLKHLGILITELLGDIISDNKAMGQILDVGNAGSTDGVDNNSDNNNTYVKAGFGTYNIAGANAVVGASDTSATRDANGTSDVDNNSDDKNTLTML